MKKKLNFRILINKLSMSKNVFVNHLLIALGKISDLLFMQW